MIKVILFVAFLAGTTLAESPYVRIVNEKLINHSGVVIKSGSEIDVLTCSHMVFLHKSENINVHFFNGDRYIGLPGDIIKRDDDADLMLVRVKNLANLKIKPVLVAGEVTDECLVRGWVLDEYREINVKFNPLETTYKNVKLLNFTGKGESGMSGSPIMANNQIVSIQSLSDRKENGVIVGAHTDEIRRFLK